jgi:glycosyltransferase involved in cell wall biosynthesis
MQRSRVRDAWYLASTLLTGRPFLIARDHMAAMHHTLKTLLAHQLFDAIHADQLWMAQYALAARRYQHQQPAPKIILDQHNAVYLIPKRLAESTANPLKQAVLALEAGKMARYEVETCQQFDYVVWVTQEDQEAVANQQASKGDLAKGKPSDIGSLTLNQQSCIIPICVDPTSKALIPRQPQAQRVTFLGGLHWPPNAEGAIWFAREVWPLVRQQSPEALLTIIGKDPPELLAEYAAGDAGVEVTGYVDDPMPYLLETAVFIVPLHAGGGMRVKILDAWAWGLPIVSTSIGAEGTHYQDGSNLLIANDASAFAQAVTHLLHQPALAQQLSQAGRNTIENEYDWHRTYRAWDSIYSPEN